MSDAKTDTDVLIVGGGPVGLTIAIGLRRFGVDCVLVERHPSTLDFPKGRRVNVRTMEIFRQWGLEDDVVATALPAADSLFVFRGDTLLADEYARMSLGTLDTPFSPTEEVVCSQEYLEPILMQKAQEAGVDIRFETRLTEFQQDADGVVARLSELDDDRVSDVRARFMIAADGARGQTRDRLGITDTTAGVMGERVSIRFVSELADRVADRLAGLYLLGQPRPGSNIATIDNSKQWLLMLPRDAEAEPEESFTAERLDELAAAAIGDPEVEFSVSGHRFWTAIARSADRFTAGNVILAGDAAHQTTPVGGLGMNCGIGDAHNLVWKVAGVVQGWAEPAVVETYDAERKPVVDWTVQASLGAAMPPKTLDGLVLGATYESAAIIADGTDAPPKEDPLSDFVPSARPGSRAAHVWIEVDGERQSTLDLWGEWFTLLVGPASSDAAVEFASSVTAPLRTHVVGGPHVIDPDGELARTYELAERGAVLVRPDGYVAWRTTDMSAEDARSALRTATGASA